MRFQTNLIMFQRFGTVFFFFFEKKTHCIRSVYIYTGLEVLQNFFQLSSSRSPEKSGAGIALKWNEIDL